MVDSEHLKRRLNVYQATALFSVLFALMGFSYNVWRMEITEQNANVRDASFAILLELAELELLVFAAHYDKDTETGNPRVGWVKVGLIIDLSIPCGDMVNPKADHLRSVWAANWARMADDREAAVAILDAIDETRVSVRDVLRALS